jgi:hypothetical protein
MSIKIPLEKRRMKSPNKLTIARRPPFLKPRLLKSEFSRTDGSEGSSRMIPDTSEAIGWAPCRFGIGYRPDLGV